MKFVFPPQKNEKKFDAKQRLCYFGSKKNINHVASRGNVSSSRVWHVVIPCLLLSKLLLCLRKISWIPPFFFFSFFFFLFISRTHIVSLTSESSRGFFRNCVKWSQRDVKCPGAADVLNADCFDWLSIDKGCQARGCKKSRAFESRLLTTLRVT